jgi:hypothetical protein
MSVDITEPTSLERAHAAAGPLGRAALAALRAPTVLGIQPWRWRLRGHVAELWADPTTDHRAGHPTDHLADHLAGQGAAHGTGADDRLVTLCCGIALHHLDTALLALGRRGAVARWPDARRADLVAVLRLTGRHRPTPDEVHAYQAMLGRRLVPAFPTARPASPLDLVAPVVPVPANGVPAGGVPVAGVTVPVSGIADPAVLLRPAGGAGGAGGEPDPVIGPIPGAVLAALRDAAEERGAHLYLPRGAADGAVGGAGIASATDDALLCATGDGPAHWLAAGEALSAVLIVAALRGVTVRPLSRTPGPVARPLPAGLGHPLLALRLSAVDRP